MKNTMFQISVRALLPLVVFVSLATAGAAANPYLGAWALTLPNGAAGWLGVTEESGQLKASILWGGGSVVPVNAAHVEAGKLFLTRIHTNERKDASGKTAKVIVTETLTATAIGDDLALTTVKSRPSGQGEVTEAFTGKRLAPPPSAPDPAKVEFGEPIALLNGKDLTGWRVTDPKVPNGWSVKDGVLVNHAPQEEGKPHKRYANLRTDAEFEDFNLKLEVRVPKGGNSGVYLRGIYEVQVFDSHGKPLDSHNMGAIYSRITPTVAAEKPAGEWQTLDLTLVDRHVTVVLNGKTIIANQPLAGCTGGALWSDVTRPGPIYLQGDHTSVEYRNLVLRPRVK